jgi:hypothetical protein
LRQGGEPFGNRCIPRNPVRSTRLAQLFNEALARDSEALCLGRPSLTRPIEVTSIFDFREASAIAAATSHPFTGLLRSICGPTSELGAPPPATPATHVRAFKNRTMILTTPNDIVRLALEAHARAKRIPLKVEAEAKSIEATKCWSIED